MPHGGSCHRYYYQQYLLSIECCEDDVVSTPTGPPAAWDVAAVLAEPTRRLIFDAVRRSRRVMTRDEVARATSVNRRLTTFHLDRLAEAGLLITDYARPEGTVDGPGAGRPAKRYLATDRELDLTLPPRHYEFAARLLAQAITDSPADAVSGSLRVAYDEGVRVGALRRPAGRSTAKRNRAAISEALTDLGYEPSAQDESRLRLRNCPFRSAAEVAPELVCGMNLELVAGLLEGLGLDRARVSLDPAPPNCCLTVATP
jgi:predicted ArsR family transcriptional regulator